MTPRYISSRPDQWTMPRPHRDASSRMHTFGPIEPMDGRVPFGTGLSSFGSSLLRSLAGSRFNPSRKEKV